MKVSTSLLEAKGDRTMCFSDPARVCSIDGANAHVLTTDGMSEVSLRVIAAAGERVEVGDWVLVSLGLVVAVVDQAEAEVLFNEMTTLRQGLEK
ncbi:MAG: hydrogenase assembly chaperone HypC/HupF [Ilumatobacter sp.]